MPTLRIPRMRHLRRRLKEGFGRQKRAENWYDSRSTALDGTGTDQVFTAAASNVVTIAGHGHSTGSGPFSVTSAGTLPAGLVAGENYWPSVIDGSTFTFHLTQFDAVNDVSPVDITDAGTGTHTMTPATNSQALVEKVRQNEITTTDLNDLSDIDDITN